MLTELERKMLSSCGVPTSTLDAVNRGSLRPMRAYNEAVLQAFLEGSECRGTSILRYVLRKWSEDGDMRAGIDDKIREAAKALSIEGWLSLKFKEPK